MRHGVLRSCLALAVVASAVALPAIIPSRTENNEACAANEVYHECGTACPATCDNMNSGPRICPAMCVMGCFCTEGFVRASGENGAGCVRKETCTAPLASEEQTFVVEGQTQTERSDCGAHATYSDCGSACEATCGNSNTADQVCPDVCVSGCFCDPGYIRDTLVVNSPCVMEHMCLEPPAGVHTGVDTQDLAVEPPAQNGNQASSAACGLNEVFTECGTACPAACGVAAPLICTLQCVVGCFCQHGFVRESATDGARCISAVECQAQQVDTPAPEIAPVGNFGLELPAEANTEVDTPQCSQNKVYQECGTACPATCGVSGPRMCTMQCVMGCFCQSGFVLESSANGAQCISHAECEARQSATQPPAPETAVATEAVCPSGEVYNECGTACPSTCTQPGPRPCAKICSRGCFCPEGFVRQSSENGAPCVQSHDCPVLHEECPVGEVYQACGTACPSSCAHPGPRPCSRICSRGCFCPVGSVRQSEENGAPCVQASSCPVPTTSPPSTVGPNADVFIDHDLIFSVTRACSDPLEVFQTCGSACPATCNDTVPAVCSMQCVQGCFCAPGFVRSEAGGRCVPQVTCANKKATVDGSDCMTCNNEMYEPLCGNDGMSYPNLCALRREECLKNKAVQVSYKRQCRTPGCNLGDRAVFNSMLVRYIQKKMEASPPRPEPIAAAGQSGSAEPEPNISRVPFKKAIYWMFDELDVNPRDRRLGKREARAFLTELKSQIGLKGCASTMWASCDYNRDHHVSLSEWCYCTGLDSVCTPEKRTMFNEKILDHIKDLKAEKEQAEGSQPEPERNPNVPTAEPRLDSPAKELVYWMFDELDVAPYDRHLSQKETWRFVEGLETNVTQRACGSSLLEHCDCNNDQRIGLNEWCWCLGLDNTCPADRRQYFQQRMLEFMNKKKALAVPEPETEPSDDSSHEPYDPRAEPRLNTPAKQTIYWMFDEL
eukprot:scpid49483/ scgid27402/ Chymotrypsin-elastase inhibitor ixodidin